MVSVKKYRRFDLKPKKEEKPVVYGTRCPCCGSDLEFTSADLNQDVKHGSYVEKGRRFSTTDVSPYYILCPVDGTRIELGRDTDELIYLIKNRKQRDAAIKSHDEMIERLYGDD